MNNSLPTQYQEFIHISRYARWLPDKRRRETWEETVARYFDFFENHLKENHNYDMPKDLRRDLEEAVLGLEVLPSMRCLMTAGKALEKENIAGYNCSYVAVDDPRAFDEALYILMNGTGLGFSVERQYVSKMPEIPEELHDTDTTVVVADSKLGWAKALKELVSLLYNGLVPKWDLGRLRPAGAPLKTFGGRASGPEPLNQLFKFVVNTFKGAKGRRLTSIECHDIMCKIGEVVVVGGVRRCLPENSLVQLVNSVKKISEVKVGDLVCSGGQIKRVLAVGASGNKKILKIKHRFGVLECTPEHQVAVFTSVGKYTFKAASELVIGDRLVWDAKGFEGTVTSLPPLEEKLHYNAKSIRIPEKMNTDLAWLFGVIQGDGYVGSKTVEITTARHEVAVLERVNEIFYNYFGISNYIEDMMLAREENSYRIRLNSAALARWFRKHIKEPKMNMSIPKFILEGTREIRFAYLAGLFDTDGRGREDNRLEQLTTVYPKFKDEIVNLLSTLGIACTVYSGSAQKRRDKGVNAQDCYSIYITGTTNRNSWLLGVENYCVTDKICQNDTVTGGNSPIDFSYPASMLDASPGYKSDGNVLLSSSLLVDTSSIYYPIPVTEIIEGPIVSTWDIEVEDIKQFTTNGIVVHNSAMISLSNLSDDRMREAKSGQWWELNSQRALANNSAVYTEKPDIGIFMKEWLSLYNSKSGERGIFSRYASKKKVASSGRRDPEQDWGTNPCSEIILRNNQFCNLSEIVVRETDTYESLARKARLATILGTWQSTLTNFRYLRKRWKDNTEEERLLGVSMTGIFDNPILNTRSKDFDKHGFKGFDSLPAILIALKDVCIATNKELAETLQIPQSTAITAVKPSGTVSQLVNSASGIHARHSPYYIRTVRADKKDPLAQFMIERGFPVEDDVMNPNNVYVFSFPVKSSPTAIFRDGITAIEHLNIWLTYQRYWCEHKPSVTITVKEHEWIDVSAWVYSHFDEMSGVSFLPHSDHIYRQAPYQDCNKEEYETLLAKMPKDINWLELAKYESKDHTVGSQELACTAGGCDI